MRKLLGYTSVFTFGFGAGAAYVIVMATREFMQPITNSSDLASFAQILADDDWQAELDAELPGQEQFDFDEDPLDYEAVQLCKVCEKLYFTGMQSVPFALATSKTTTGVCPRCNW